MKRMKRMKMVNVGIAVMAAVLLTMFTGCPTEDNASGAKTLTSIKVGNVDPESMPAPISSGQWKDTNFYPQPNTNYADIILENNAALSNAAIAATVSSKAKVAFGIYDSADRKSTQFNVTSPHTFTLFDVLAVRVTAEDGSANYYLFTIVTATSDTKITRLTIAGVTVEGLGLGSDEWDGVTTPATVSISASLKDNAALAATIASGASVKYVIAEDSPSTKPTYAAVAELSFTDGDFLYIEVTAADQVTVKYYKAEVWVGRNAKLESVAMNYPETTEAYLGTPALTWAGVVPGNFFTERLNDEGTNLGLKAVPEDPDSTMDYAVVQESTPGIEPTWVALAAAGITAPVATFDPDKQYYVYLKVTPSAGDDYILYYKLKITFPATGRITYGTPSFGAPDEFFIDPLWNAADLFSFDISRVNLAESISAYFKEPWGQHTRATGKALWDDDGIYVYVDVEFNKYRETEDGELKDRPVTTGGDYTSDSVEIFVNERLQILESSASKNLGNQFRVAANGNRTGAGTLGSVIADFTDPAYPNTRARIKGNGTNTGYEVLAFVPFAGKTSTDASSVFNTNGTVKENAKIGFELQLNTAVVNATRDGILTWNGVNTQSYQNASGYGEVKLALDGRQRVTNAQRPVITTQPKTSAVSLNDTLTLSVAANVGDGGNLTYQWYSATTSSGAGTPINTNGTGTSYTVPTNAAGYTYYYAVVTNTNNSVNGQKIVTTTSSRALVYIGSATPDVWTEKVVGTGAGTAVYGFFLPVGKKMGDYNRLKVKIKTAPDEGAFTEGRFRVWGPYAYSAWNKANQTRGLGNTGATVGNENALLIGTGNDNLTAVDDSDWVGFTFSLATASLHDNPKGLEGIILLAVGVIGPGGAQGTWASKPYLIKDIELDNTDGSVASVFALKPNSPLLWDGEGANKYATDNGPVTRELQP